MEPLDAAGRVAHLVGSETVWIRLDEESAVGAGRRAAVGLAESLGFAAARVGEVAIAVTEMATNLHRHSRDGVLVLRIRRPHLVAGPDGAEAVEAIAVDAGPGMADLNEHRTDGYSTAGTLGVGLGAISRLASRFHAYSSPGHGTVLIADFNTGPKSEAPALAAGLTRAMTGETACGDAYALRPIPQGLVAILADGLGHGPLAATAGRAAVDAFLDSTETEPGALLDRVHRRIGHTRGAAVSIVTVDHDAGTARFTGLGNVAGSIVTDTADGHRTRGMVSMPGIAGHQARALRTYDYPLGPGALVVLHTDGLSSRWTFDGQWAVTRQDPLVVAAVLMRDAGTRRDDAGVVVIGGAGVQ